MDTPVKGISGGPWRAQAAPKALVFSQLIPHLRKRKTARMH